MTKKINKLPLGVVLVVSQSSLILAADESVLRNRSKLIEEVVVTA